MRSLIPEVIKVIKVLITLWTSDVTGVFVFINFFQNNRLSKNSKMQKREKQEKKPIIRDDDIWNFLPHYGKMQFTWLLISSIMKFFEGITVLVKNEFINFSVSLKPIIFLMKSYF